MRTVEADSLVDTIVARLVRRTRQDPDLVAVVVRHEAHRLAHARITAYLPVLVEHAALGRLRELAVEQRIEDGDDHDLPRRPGEVALSTWRGDSWLA